MPPINTSILIIENDPPTLELYRRELSRDYHVLPCQNETEALRLAQTEKLCAVVMEPSMPGGNGWELFANLRRMFAGKRVPIILCSTQDERKRGIAEGAAAFLVKPVLPITLHALLDQILTNTSFQSA